MSLAPRNESDIEARVLTKSDEGEVEVGTNEDAAEVRNQRTECEPDPGVKVRIESVAAANLEVEVENVILEIDGDHLLAGETDGDQAAERDMRGPDPGVL